MTTTTDSGFVTVTRQGEAEHSQRPSSIACVIPAYNEEETIEQVLDALLTQTRPPDVIHLVINNTTDETFYLARRYAGEHTHTYHDITFTTFVFVHDIGKNIDKKVGALNYGFAKVADDFDYLLGVDGDTILEPDTVEQLEAEARRPFYFAIVFACLLSLAISPEVFRDPFFLSGLGLVPLSALPGALVSWKRYSAVLYWVIPLLQFAIIAGLRAGSEGYLVGLSLIAVFPVIWLSWFMPNSRIVHLVNFAATFVIV